MKERGRGRERGVRVQNLQNDERKWTKRIKAAVSHSSHFKNLISSINF